MIGAQVSASARKSKTKKTTMVSVEAGSTAYIRMPMATQATSAAPNCTRGPKRSATRSGRAAGPHQATAALERRLVRPPRQRDERATATLLPASRFSHWPWRGPVSLPLRAL